ncbi:MAG: acetylornithine deacetylase (ArgE) [Rhizobiales bacterium NRL2]|jgi:acetylornithine deacetylase|nr:MAG: acetylornithine deacetylase (ArgE) [Rhizobiales bacterium NRL2]
MNSQTDNAIEILERLVGFDTTSRDSNLPLIDWTRDYLGGLGIESRKVMSEDGRKANLVATIGGDGDGGVVLSGHTDVVPVDGQDWRTDPFRLTRKGDRLYGRGASDMKGFIACALAAAPRLKENRLSRPVHFAFSHDEEVGCLGVGGIIDHFATTDLRPAMCLVGEPTMMRVVNAQKGCTVFHTTLKGREVHSSQIDRGVNTVYYGAELVSFIAGLAEERMQRPAPAFDPPYTTVHVGLMHGGTAVNIVPNHCEIRWEYRAVPGDDGADIRERVQAFIEENLLPRMRKGFPEASVETIVKADVPGLAPEPDGAAETLFKRLAGRNDTEAVSYGTEGGIFQEAGMSTVICGPGDIGVAHQPNEFVDVDQISRCMDLMDRLVAHLAD